MIAVILAGGKGTRLGELTRDIPKPMIEIAGKPILLHQIELCKRYGVHTFYFIVNHLYEPIKAYFGDGTALGIQIHYYIEPQPLGTVGGVKAIASQLNETFLVLYGDVMLNMDLDQLYSFHVKKNADVTLVLHPNDHPYDSDLVEMDVESKITAFHSKPHEEGVFYRNLVNAGVYVFEPIILDALQANVKADFGKDIFPLWVNTYQMYGYNTTEYLKDMGTPDRLEKVTNDFVTGKMERSNRSHLQRCIFLDRDGVLNEDIEYIHTPEQMQLFPYTAEAVKKINNSEYLSIVVTNQPVVARNSLTEAGLRQIHNKMEWELGVQRCKVDDIFYCPHHPHKGYEGENIALKIDCDCRKPKPGMLFKAAQQYHIDLANSWMIGDAERDLLAGAAASCTSVGLRSGAACKGSQFVPDYMFDNLLQAVDFIVDEPFLHVFNQIELRRNNHTSSLPFVINIGGNTGCGKSTLATYLEKKYQKNNVNVLRINLDNWLLSKEMRDASNNVFERYQILQMIKDMFSIMKGNTVQLYKHSHQVNVERETISYKYTQEDIVLIEGVVALSMPQLRGLSHCKIFMKISDIELKNRLYSFNTWKGYKSNEIDSIFEKRIKDEYELIAYDEQFAHLTINYTDLL